ncbi:hypothetical protein HI914_01776 [Erysiphe necator]|nr:hypothetical protein HI914_01776 [Erysiphe necator]
MPIDNFELEQIIQGLVENLNILVDQTPKLIDREKILSEKLEIARGLYKQLASKYAIGDLEVTNALEQLNSPVPISMGNNCPYASNISSEQNLTSQSQLTTVIDNVRLVSHQLTKIFNQLSGSTLSPKIIPTTSESLLNFNNRAPQSTLQETDLTVSVRKSTLECPFPMQQKKLELPSSKTSPQLRINVGSGLEFKNNDLSTDNKDMVTRKALCCEIRDFPNSATTSSKCPIRYLGQRSPEEVARYFEVHKHEIPRSHEICLKRQQKNEDHIRKLDAKYGDLVNIIEVLGQKHQPLLPDTHKKLDTPLGSNERLESWVRNVSCDESNQENKQESSDKNDQVPMSDRPLKEVRVGESPSRPWGISVPFHSPQNGSKQDFSRSTLASTVNLAKSIEKNPSQENKTHECFCEKNLSQVQESQRLSVINNQSNYIGDEPPIVSNPLHHTNKPQKSLSNPHVSPVNHTRPNFVKTHDHSLSASNVQKTHMLFTGPVFIDYPTEEAIKIIQKLGN